MKIRRLSGSPAPVMFLFLLLFLAPGLMISGCNIDISVDGLSDDSKQAASEQSKDGENAKSSQPSQDTRNQEEEPGTATATLDLSYFFPDASKQYVFDVDSKYKAFPHMRMGYTVDGSDITVDETYIYETGRESINRYKYAVSGEGIKYLSASQINGSDELLLVRIDGGTYLQYPYYEPGEGCDYSYSMTSHEDGSGLEGAMEVNYVGVEPVDVMGKTRDAAHISLSDANIYSEKEKRWVYQAETDMWFVKGLGIVKYETNKYYMGAPDSFMSWTLTEVK